MSSPTNKVTELPSSIIDSVISCENGRLASHFVFIEIERLFAYEQWKAVVFAEWIEEKHWWKSTDTRFPETLGRWTTAINGNIPIEQTLTTTELYNCEAFKEYLEKRRKEEGK